MISEKTIKLEAIKGNSELKIKQIADESVDIICIDPPYLYLKNQKLEREFDEFKFFEQCKRVLTKNGFIILFGRGTSFYRWNTILADLGFVFKEEVVWDKRLISSPVTPIGRRHETIAIFSKEKGKINDCRIDFIEKHTHDPEKIKRVIDRISTTFGNRKTFDLLKNYYSTGEKVFTKSVESKFNATRSKNSNVNQNRTVQFAASLEDGIKEQTIIAVTRDHYNTIHPTQKPVRLLERLIQLVLPAEKPRSEVIVVDFFAGSFSCGEACFNLGVNFKGFEIDSEYFENGRKRMEVLQHKLF